jgi:hypothetical protein
LCLLKAKMQPVLVKQALIINLYVINDRYPTEVVIPAKAGIQLESKPRIAGQNCDVVRFAEHLFHWIPAFAGMTT